MTLEGVFARLEDPRGGMTCAKFSGQGERFFSKLRGRSHLESQNDRHQREPLITIIRGRSPSLPLIPEFACILAVTECTDARLNSRYQMREGGCVDTCALIPEPSARGR
jgi:hypothetical protein